MRFDDYLKEVLANDSELRKEYDALYDLYNSISNELWEGLITDHFFCKHEECPYKNCMYHKYSDKPTYFYDEDIPFYVPKSNEEMKDCMSFMDI